MTRVDTLTDSAEQIYFPDHIVIVVIS